MQLVRTTAPLAYDSSGPAEFNLGCLDRLGRRKGRLEIEKTILEVTVNVTVDAGDEIDPPDWSSIVSQFRQYDMEGLRRDLTGPEMRLAQFLDLRDHAPRDPAKLAAGTGSITLYLVVSHALDHALRDVDTALPVDDALDGRVEFHWATAGNVLSVEGDGITSINSGSAKLHFLLREARGVEFKCRDILTSKKAKDDTQFSIPINGQAIRAMTLFKAAHDGGTDVSTVTSVTIDKLGYSATPRAVFREAYLLQGNVHRDAYSAGTDNRLVDPVFNELALPILFPRRRAKVRDYPIIGGDLEIKLNSTFTSPRILLHTFDKKSAAMIAAAKERNGLAVNAPERVKTHGKTGWDPQSWKGLGKFMPSKAVKAA